ncbi:MAG: surface-adhesin E family protein [Thermodesulfobacteriota bacterium]
MKNLILLSILLFPSISIAQEWVLVSEGESGSKVYVDKSSIQKADNNTKAQVKQTFNSDLVASDNKTKYNQLNVTYLFNCKAAKVAVIEGKKINSSGETVKSDKFDDLTWVSVKPDTVLSYAIEYSCSYTGN